MVGNKINKLVFILVPLLILMLLPTTSALEFTGETTGQWTKYGFDRFSSNGYPYFTGSYNADIDNGTNFTYTDNEGSGGNFQPIAFDWDSDGVVEIISPQGTTLNVYNPSSNALVIEDTYNMGGTMATQGWCGTDDTLGKYCVFNMGTYLVSLSYSNDVISTIATASLRGTTIGSAINCHSDTDEYDIPYCFAIVDNTTESKVYLAQFRADSEDDLSFTRIGRETTLLDSRYKPIISDIDYDDTLEIIWSSRDDSSNEGVLSVYEWNETTNVISPETSFSADGQVAYGGGVMAKFCGIVVYDLDGGTDEEICTLSTNNIDHALDCFNSDGSSFSALDAGSKASGQCNSLLLGDVTGDITQKLIAMVDHNGPMKVSVYDGSSGSLTTTSSETFADITDNDLSSVMGKVNDDSYFDLIYGNRVMYFNSTGEIYANDTKNFVEDQNIVPVEFNQDATMDFVGQKLNSLSLYTNEVGGTVATSSITLNTLKEDSGFYGYYDSAISPVCLNSNETYRAKECISGEFDSTCTYVNTNGIGTERLVSDCGGLASITGEYDYLNPDVDCNWTAVGSYEMVLYIQDVASATYYGVYDTISVDVIDGVEGVTCNKPNGLITSPAVTDTEVADPDTSLLPSEVTTFFDIFGTGSNLAQFFVGLILIIGLFMIGFQTTKAIMGGITFAIFGLILCVVIGLISLWVVMLVGFLMLLPIVLKLFYSS